MAYNEVGIQLQSFDEAGKSEDFIILLDGPLTRVEQFRPAQIGLLGRA